MPSEHSIVLRPQSGEGMRKLIADPAGADPPPASGLIPYFQHMTEPYLAKLDGRTPWAHCYYAIDEQQRLIVGFGAFKDPPTPEGLVEIAYCTAPELENRGYATATAAELTRIALDHPTVRTVVAHTLPTRNASGSVLTKCGFVNVGQVIDPEDGPVWQWEKRRPVQ
jgi:RimJ/RimL family protein N-acetyltransferase